MWRGAGEPETKGLIFISKHAKGGGEKISTEINHLTLRAGRRRATCDVDHGDRK